MVWTVFILYTEWTSMEISGFFQMKLASWELVPYEHQVVNILSTLPEGKKVT